MRAFNLTCSLYWSILVCIAYASNDEELYDALCQKNLALGERLSLVSRMSFKQAVVSKGLLNDETAYLSEISSRPEIASVSWGCGDVMKLANQIWQLRHDRPDTTYHKNLYHVCKQMMKASGEKRDTIDDVMGILGDWSKARGKRQLGVPKKMSLEEYEKKKIEKRIYNTEATRRRRGARRQGLNMPLMEYMPIEILADAPPQKLHEEALHHMDRYSSAHAFYISLRNLFKTLAIEESRWFRLVKDPRIAAYYRTRSKEAKRQKEMPANREQMESQVNHTSDQIDFVFGDLELNPLASMSGYNADYVPQDDDYLNSISFEAQDDDIWNQSELFPSLYGMDESSEEYTIHPRPLKNVYPERLEPYQT